MGSSPTGGHNGGGGIVGGRDLHLPPPEHSHIVYCDQAHYGPMSGGGAEDGVKYDQVVMVTGQNRFGGDADRSLGGRTDVGGGGNGRDGDGLNQ